MFLVMYFGECEKNKKFLKSCRNVNDIYRIFSRKWERFGINKSRNVICVDIRGIVFRVGLGLRILGL